MKNGLPRYYKEWNKNPGPNYFVFDRTTGKKIFECWEKEKAEIEVRRLIEEDRKQRGIVIEDEVEVSTCYSGYRDKTPKDIGPMVRHGSPAATTTTAA